MSCCNPEYRKVVEEQENKVNQKGKDSLSLSAKITIILITIGSISAFFLL